VRLSFMLLSHASQNSVDMMSVVLQTLHAQLDSPGDSQPNNDSAVSAYPEVTWVPQLHGQ
jgi:hypothetical protein